MGSNGRDRDGSGNLHERIKGIAFAWDTLDNSIYSAREDSGLHIRGFKCINKGSTWLIIVQANVGDKPVVCFREATSSGDIGKVIRGIIEDPDWKDDKFAKLTNS